MTLLATVVLSAVSALPASAEETVDLDAVTVTATDISTRTERQSTYKSSAMSTTTGLALSPRETPQSVSNVTMTRIEDQGISDLADAMRNTTGVTVLEDNGGYRFFSRGFTIDQIQEDGISSSVRGGSGGNSMRDPQSMTDIAIYDHLEIVRGPTGLTQSNSEPGGTINAVRKRPTAELQASASIEAGSWDIYRAVGDVSGSINEAKTLRGRFVGVLNRKGSFKDDVYDKSGTIYGVLEADLDPDTVLSVGAIYQKESKVPDYFGVPLDKNGHPFDLPVETYLGLDWTKSHYKKTNLFAELEHYFNDEWRLDLKANYLRYASDFVLGGLIGLGNGGSPAGNPMGMMNNMQNYDNTGWQAAFVANINGVYPLFGRKHDLFITANYNREHSDSAWLRVLSNKQFYLPGFTGNEIPEPDWSDTSKLDLDRSYDSDRSDLGLLVGTRYNLTDAWHLIAGARYVLYKAKDVQHYTITGGAPDLDPDKVMRTTTTHLTPYGGLTWDFSKTSSLYVSYTEIFQPQGAGTVDKSGKLLDPVIGSNYELGVKTEWFNRRLNTSVAVYQLNQKNRAYSVDNTDYYVALGEIRSRGFEAEASGELLPGWNLFAGYSFNVNTYEKDKKADNEGVTYAPYTPKHILRLYTTLELPGALHRWRIGGGAQIQSRVKSINNVEQGGYAVWDASLQYKITDTIKADLMVNNIFDRRYFLNNKTRTYRMNNFYGDPRNFLLRVTAEY